MAFIRPFKPEDTDAAKHICRATLPPSLASSSGAVALSPYLWALPFTTLRPQHCHILDDGAGNAVGYVLGAPDVFALADEWERYVRECVKDGVEKREVPQLGEEDFQVREEWWKDEEEKVVNERCLGQLVYKPDWLLLGKGEENPQELEHRPDSEGKKTPTKEEMVRQYRAIMHIDLLPPFQRQGWGMKMIERFVEGIKASGEEFGKGVMIAIAPENGKVVKFYEKCEFRGVEGGVGEIWMVREL